MEAGGSVGRRCAWGGLSGKNCASGENKCRFCRRGTKKSIPLRPVSYPAMNHGDRMRRTRQAHLVSSACPAAPEGGEGRSLRAPVRHGAVRDAVTPGTTCDSLNEMLKLTNANKIMQRGGVILGIRSKSFDIQNHTRHAMTPPRRDARTDMLHKPSTPRPAMRVRVPCVMPSEMRLVAQAGVPACHTSRPRRPVLRAKASATCGGAFRVQQQNR